MLRDCPLEVRKVALARVSRVVAVTNLTGNEVPHVEDRLACETSMQPPGEPLFAGHAKSGPGVEHNGNGRFSGVRPAR